MTPEHETPNIRAHDRSTPRLASRNTLVLLGGVIGLLLIAAAAYFYLHMSASEELTERIDTRLNQLSVRPATVELTSEIALHVRRAVIAGDFKTANRITAAVFAHSQLQYWSFYPYKDFITDVLVTPLPKFGKRLDQWVAQDRTNATPLLLRAQYYCDIGWAERGHNSANKTAPERMAAFVDDMKKAFADVNAAISLDRSNPYSFYLRLRILQGGGLSPAIIAAFADGIATFPKYYPLYEITLTTLQPRWGGTIPAMYAFVDQYAGRAPRYSPLKLLYLSLYRHLLSTASVDCSGYGDRDRIARCIDAFMEKAVRPGLERNVSAALHLYDHTDKYQSGLAIKGIISDMLAASGGDTFAGTALQLAADAMHSDTQLEEKNPGRNDYIVDELVAESWHDKGFYNNEIKKYNEALTDAQRSDFPNEEAKDEAIAAIYEQLSAAAAQQHNFVDEIAFEKAAVLLGLKWDSHYICHGYYELKQYSLAIQACTDAIKGTDNSYAWYWRGEAYHHSGHQDRALSDLKKSADADDYFAPYAAIDMALIYSGRADNRAALSVLNRYQFLYDPGRTDRSMVAVAYNNRCYTYMQLGDLRKALNDCTQSLKYGSIPDAFRKQQELMKRLGSSQKSL